MKKLPLINGCLASWPWQMLNTKFHNTCRILYFNIIRGRWIASLQVPSYGSFDNRKLTVRRILLREKINFGIKLWNNTLLCMACSVMWVIGIPNSLASSFVAWIIPEFQNWLDGRSVLWIIFVSFTPNCFAFSNTDAITFLSAQYTNLLSLVLKNKRLQQ